MLLKLLLLELLELLQLLELLELLKLLLLLLQGGILLRVLRLVIVLRSHLTAGALIHDVGGLSGRGINESVDVRLGRR